MIRMNLFWLVKEASNLLLVRPHLAHLFLVHFVRDTTQFWEIQQWPGVVIATDCQNLVKASQDQEEAIPPSWHALDAILKIGEEIREGSKSIHIKFVSRQAISAAHHLANWPRQTGQRRRVLQLESIIPIELARRIFDPGIFSWQ